MIKREITTTNNVVNETRNHHQHQHVSTHQPQVQSSSASTAIQLDEINQNDNQIANFFWTEIDKEKFPNLFIPYIVKKNDIKYLSVRIIERVILSKYENSYSEEVKQYGCLNSELCTASDVALLNEINDYHVNKEYGAEAFTLKDTLVKLDDFLQFYEILSRTCRTKEAVAKLNSSKNISNIYADQQRKLLQQQQVLSQVNKQSQPHPPPPIPPLPPPISSQIQQQQQSQLNVPDFVFNTHSNNNRPITSPNMTNTTNRNYNERDLQYLQAIKQNTMSNNIIRSNSSTKPMPLSREPIQNQNSLINQQKQHIPPFNTDNATSTKVRQESNSINNNPSSRLVHNSLSTSSTLSSLSDLTSISPRVSTIDPFGLTNNRSSLEQQHYALQNHLYNNHNKQQQMNHLYSKSPVPQPLIHSPTQSVLLNSHNDQTNEIFYNNNSIDPHHHHHHHQQHHHLHAANPYLINDKSNQVPNRTLNNVQMQQMPYSPQPTYPSPYGQHIQPTQGSHLTQNKQPLSSQPQPRQMTALLPPPIQHQTSQLINPMVRALNSNQQSFASQNLQPQLLNRPSNPTYSNYSNQPPHRVSQQPLPNPPIYSSSNSNSVNHSMLNSPTPPLTPTPSLYSYNTNNTMSLAATSPANRNSLAQTINSELITRLNDRSSRTSVDSNQSQHSVQMYQQPHHLIPPQTTANTNSPQHQQLIHPIKKQNSLTNLNTSLTTTNDDDNDDIIILDEPFEPSNIKSTHQSLSRVSSLQTSTSTRSSVDTTSSVASLYSIIENHNSGFIQLNDLVVPYIRLLFRPYRCCSQYQPSNIYIPWRLLASTGLIQKDVEHSLIGHFNTIFTLEKKLNPTEFNRLYELIESMDLKYKFDVDKVVVVNLLDFFSHCREALFLKQHKLGKPLILNFRDILKMSGGIILLDIPDGPRDLLIFPFVNHSNLVLAPLNTFTNYIRHFDANKVDYSPEKLEKETFQGTTQETLMIRHFLNLLLFYLTDNERRCKLPTAIRLINVKPWLDKHANEFKILCRYTPEFPIDWIESIDTVLIKFKLFTKTLNSNNSELNNGATNSDGDVRRSGEEELETIIQTKEKDNLLNDKEQEQQQQQQQPEQTQSEDKLEEKEPEIAAVEVQEKQTNLNETSDQNNRNPIETVSLSPSSMDSVTPSVSPFSSSTNSNLPTKEENKTKEDFNNRLSEQQNESTVIELSRVVEVAATSNNTILETVSENANDSLNNSEKNENEVANKLNEIEMTKTKQITFDFDDIDTNVNAYEMFKLKRRLSDSILSFKKETTHYKQYLDDEMSLSRETQCDRLVNQKIDELNKELELELEKKAKTETKTLELVKNEPSSPVPVIEPEKEEETLKNKRSASLTSISSLVSSTKRAKYAEDGLEDISDSDGEFSLILNAKNPNEQMESDEEFDENYYLKKFNIQDCCVLLKDVGTNDIPQMPKKHSYSIDSMSINSENSKTDLGCGGSGVNKSETKITKQRDRKLSSTTTTSTESTHLLQPLNCNQTTFKSSLTNNAKHKENKIGK